MQGTDIQSSSGQPSGNGSTPHARRATAEILRVDGVSKEFKVGGGVVTALRSVDLQLREGEFIAIRGRSGAGKTTLLNIIAGLDDPTHGRVVLFGGAALASGKPEPLGDTWEWDGRAWRRIDVTGPGARDHVAMTYSPVHRAIVLHSGGSPTTGMLADSWLYDGRAWTRLLDAGPPRGRHRLVYDPDQRAVMLYGGYDGRERTSELWALRARTWERLAP